MVSSKTPVNGERKVVVNNETEMKQFEAFASKLDVECKKQSPSKTFDLLQTSSLKKEDIKVSDVKITKRPNKPPNKLTGITSTSNVSQTEFADDFVQHYL